MSDFSRVPPPKDPHQTQVTTLTGVQYVIKYDWIQRASFWTLGLYTTNGDEIAAGIPLVGGGDLLAPFRSDPRTPPGLLAVVDQRGTTDPDFGSWGTRHLLWYIEPPE